MRLAFLAFLLAAPAAIQAAAQPVAAPQPAIEATAVAGFPGAQLFRAPGAARLPVVILLGGSEGGASFGQAMGPLLAARGYAALSLPYYSPDWGRGRAIPELPDSFADIPVDRLAAVRDWIAAQAHLDARRIGIVGVSKGGEFAMIAATRFPWMRAVAGIVPSDVVWEGWGPAVTMDGTRSSFAWRGEPLAFVPYRGMRETIARLERGERAQLRDAHDNGRAANPGRVAAATIPVERYRGPMLVAGADKDSTWASGAMARAIAARRAKAGLSTELLTFPDAGHALNGDGTGDVRQPDEPAATLEAQKTVRAALLAFLARALRPEAPARSSTPGAAAPSRP